MRNLLAIAFLLVIFSCCTGNKAGLDSILRIENYYFNQNNDDLSIKVVINDEPKGKCHIKHISNDSIILEHDNADLFFTGKNTTTLYRLRN